MESCASRTFPVARTEIDVLKGRLVTLRPFRADDLPIMREWFRDPETSRWWGLSPIVPGDKFEFDLAGKFQKFERDGYFAIEDATGKLVGRIEYEHFDPFDRTAEIMILLGRTETRGKGIGTDALVTLLAYFFRDRQAERAWLTVLTWNEAAIRLYEKVGFVREGRLISDCWIDRQYHDQFVMGMLREEFESKWSASRLVAE
jgi:RimJ/RimL family protein N-acetyltransferase